MMHVGFDFVALLGPIWVDFGARLAAKLDPSWHQSQDTWGPLIINDAFRVIPSKTGMSDESVMITDKRFHPLLEALKISRPDIAPL